MRRAAALPSPAPNALGLAGWRELADATACPRRRGAGGSGRPDRAKRWPIWSANWPRDLPGGVIHADLFPDNVLFMQDKVSGLIDFYFACNDMYAYDLAVTLNSWCFESDGAYNITKGKALIAGYQRGRAADARTKSPPCRC